MSSGSVKRKHPKMGTLIINVFFPFFLYMEQPREVDILCADVLIWRGLNVLIQVLILDSTTNKLLTLRFERFAHLGSDFCSVSFFTDNIL